MKPENCGRCGLEPVELGKRQIYDRVGAHHGEAMTYGCPVHNHDEMYGAVLANWNADQFAIRTERINAAAVAITSAGFGDSDYFADVVGAAERLIDAQDAAARVRWAEMQKGE